MMNFSITKITNLITILFVCLSMTACISTLVGAVVDTTIAVVKIPFKVGAAIIDVVTPGDLTDEQSESESEAFEDSDKAAVQMESEGI